MERSVNKESESSKNTSYPDLIRKENLKVLKDLRRGQIHFYQDSETNNGTLARESKLADHNSEWFSNKKFFN